MDRNLILASQSPRRRELLGLLGIPFEVVPSRTDETPKPQEAPVDFVRRAAREKGAEVSVRVQDAIVIAADTIVSVDGGIFGKPADRDDAVRMLETLSGREHSVYTAVSVVDSASGTCHEGMDETRVWFSSISRRMIDHYLGLEDVMDKAGAYAIQGFASVFIPRIEGNYGNVMGLPLSLTYSLLSRHGVVCDTSS
jgi:septum formation protein